MCIFFITFAADLICASMRSRSAISLMGPIGQIGLIGRREDAELQDGQRPEGKESGVHMDGRRRKRRTWTRSYRTGKVYKTK